MINKIDGADSKHIDDAIKSCFDIETYQKIVELQSEYDIRLRELDKQMDSSKLKEAFVGKYIKIDNSHNFPNSSYNTYAYVKNVYVTDNNMWGMRLSLVCAAFDTIVGNDSRELNKIGNFDKSRYIDFNLDNFLDFSIGFSKDDSQNKGYLSEYPRTLVDNEPKLSQKNGILTFITAEEFRRVYDEYTEKLFNDMISK